MNHQSANLQQLAAALRARSTEIVEVTANRLQREVPEYYQVASSEFQAAGYGAVCDVVACACAALDDGRVPAHLPSRLAEEAQSAARSDMPWEVLARSYGITHEVLLDTLVVELGGWSLRRDQQLLSLRAASRSLFRCFDFLSTAAGRMYEDERRRLPDSSTQKKTELVELMLRGLPISDAELGYATCQDHVGVVAWGENPRAVVQAAGRSLRAETFLVPRSGSSVWAWLGRLRFESGSYDEVIAAFRGDDRTHVAIGSVQRDRAGFVATHEQAQLASLVAARRLHWRGGTVTAYPDVAVETMALADESRAHTFVDYALGELVSPGATNAKLRATLLAYYEASESTKGAARQLGVADRTVRYRLRLAQDRIGKQVASRDIVALAIRVFAALEAQGRARPITADDAQDGSPRKQLATA